MSIAAAALTIVAAAGVVSTSSPAQALYPCGAGTYCEWVYYSNQTYTTIIGLKQIGCYGGTYNQGSTSPYYRFQAEAC